MRKVYTGDEMESRWMEDRFMLVLWPILIRL